MNGGFTKGLIVGGIIGASVSMMSGQNRMKGRTKRKMMRAGRNLLKRSGNILGDVVEMFR
ncbi:MAG: YtxH domain-containing protein [Clostridia bacterium]|nr:YtxH domain-containing protein [Clostridia bacterium]